MAREKFRVKLIKSCNIASEVKQLSFVKEDGTPLHFIAGQFINLHFEFAGEMLQRSYSIANTPNDNQQFDIALSYVANGRASQFFFELPIGSIIEASGPVGRLILTEQSPKRYLFIGTGTGVAPYRAMLPELSERLNQEKPLNIYLLFGTRTRKELLYHDDFHRFAQNKNNFHYYACLSREPVINQNNHEYSGRVTQCLKELNVNPRDDIIYLCGNPAMIDEAFEYCKAQGFDNTNVRREKYVMSKR